MARESRVCQSYKEVERGGDVEFYEHGGHRLLGLERSLARSRVLDWVSLRLGKQITDIVSERVYEGQAR